MAVLRRLLVQVHDVRIAVPVAEMLCADRDYFHESLRVSSDRLTPFCDRCSMGSSGSRRCRFETTESSGQTEASVALTG